MVSEILYICSDLSQIAEIDSKDVDVSKRLSYQRLAPQYKDVVTDMEGFVRSVTPRAMIMEVPRYLIGRRYLKLMKRAVASGVPTFIYWAGEETLERVGHRRLLLLRGQWLRQYVARRIAGGSPLPQSELPTRLPDEALEEEAAPVEPTEMDTIIGHFSGAVDELGQNLEGLSQTRLSGEGVSQQATQLEADLSTALERVMNLVETADNAVDTNELDQRRSELQTVRDGARNVADSLQVVENILRNHHAYLDTGVGMIKDFDKRLRGGGMMGGAGLTPYDVPKIIERLNHSRKTASAVALKNAILGRDGKTKVAGTGMYFRLDYWAPMISGGSYGHTTYVVKELAKSSDDFVCMMANRLPVIDDLGVSQVVIDSPTRNAADLSILSVAEHFTKVLRPSVAAVKPAYIYERLSLGNTAGATLSKEFDIPYIVEYNGSEISLKRSFDGSSYEQETAFLAAEAFAFEQATLITVVSEHVKDDLLERGIPESKILVNPNCVDPTVYRPAEPAEKLKLRKELGIPQDKTVIGFIGSFGGWHGIDVLSESLHPVIEAAPDVYFLLVGDGNFRHLIDEKVDEHGLHDRVMLTGRVAQPEGARLLQACDIYVSPHSSHMVDRKFFGSPTKLFEYLSMGGGVVASDLEQIGEVMRPSFTPDQLNAGKLEVTNQRGVLCDPGDTDSFVKAVVGLARNAKASAAMGKNARDAAKKYYTWESHVENLFRHMNGHDLVGYVQDIGNK